LTNPKIKNLFQLNKTSHPLMSGMSPSEVIPKGQLFETSFFGRQNIALCGGEGYFNGLFYVSQHVDHLREF
jgi:hypothetical protein